ncbi:hypothetical protein [Reichenbachiella versicolor]|uniref:hypothetical protein n=1 Tax=Reichenbachiella versicolor TaxID=1821036 RepID=UPI000D6E9596|nr:hypothetical protein [Reichenbachiella versicolor]
MIQTNPITLSKEQFFKLLLVRYIKQKWWLLTIMLIFVVSIASQDVLERTDFIFLAMFISYPLLIVFQLWRWVNSDENKAFLTERIYCVNDSLITGKTDENNFSTVEKNNLIKSEIILGTYLLYITKNQFFYLPFSSFQSEEDRIWFENNYISRRTN